MQTKYVVLGTEETGMKILKEISVVQKWWWNAGAKAKTAPKKDSWGVEEIVIKAFSLAEGK